MKEQRKTFTASLAEKRKTLPAASTLFSLFIKSVQKQTNIFVCSCPSLLPPLLPPSITSWPLIHILPSTPQPQVHLGQDHKGRRPPHDPHPQGGGRSEEVAAH